MLRSLSLLWGLLIPQVLLAQAPDHHHLPTAPSRWSTLVWDAARGRTLAFEWRPETRVWHWDGGEWSLLGGVSGPAPGAAFYNPLDQRVIGYTGDAVLAWDGARWSGLTTTGGLGYSAFDPVRRRLVTTDGASVREWDGAQWQARNVGVAPGTRHGLAFAYDPAQVRCLLYGGGTMADCWSWDGTSWTLLAQTAPPGPRNGATLAFEPSTNRMILFGGDGAAATTWVLQGTNWSQVPTTVDPGERAYSPQLAWDGTGLLLHGGSRTRGGELWRFANDDWEELDGGVPEPRYDATIGWDHARGEAVVLGGHDEISWTSSSHFFQETWTFDGRWHRHDTSTFPGVWLGASHPMAWSSAEGQLLLWEGPGNIWSWTGTDWVRRTPSTSPSWRAWPAFATDPAGGVLLFGGTDTTTSPQTMLGDTWHWDGTDWQQRNPAVSPSARREALAALDPVRNVVVLVGGHDNGTYPTDTWEWDGNAWAQRATVSPVTTSSIGQLTFRPETGHLLLHNLSDLHEWDGTTWTMLPTTVRSIYYKTLLTDPTRGDVLVYPWYANQEGDFGILTTSLANAARYGSGCALGPAPALVTIGRPVPGQAGFAVTAVTGASNTPTFLALGLDSTWQPLGSGCSLLVGNVLGVQFATTSGIGDASWSLPIPGNPALHGITFTAQCAAVDPARSLFGGLTISDGLRITIGS